MTLRLFQFSALLSAVLVLGCGSGESLPTVPVTGTVTLNGAPVAGAAVAFAPKDPAKGKPASGTTDASGKFKLTTYLSPTSSPEGAIPGDYQISVTKVEVPSTSMSPEDMAKGMAGGGTMKPPENLLPSRYANPAASGFTASVKSGGTNDFTFALEEK